MFDKLDKEFQKNRFLNLLKKLYEGSGWLNKNWDKIDRKTEILEFDLKVSNSLDSEWLKLTESQRIAFLRQGSRTLPQ